MHKHRREKKLLYTVWDNPGRYGEVYQLGTTDQKDSAEYMSIVEHFWAVALQTLMPKHLDHWLPEDFTRQSEVGVNVALPIYQMMEIDIKKSGWQYCCASSDPEVQAYARDIIDRIHATAAKTDYREMSITQRGKDTLRSSRYRGPGEGDPTEVRTHCGRCKRNGTLIWIDRNPTFSKFSGAYIVRERSLCPVCPLNDREKAKGVKHALTSWIPMAGQTRSFVYAARLESPFA